MTMISLDQVRKHKAAADQKKAAKDVEGGRVSGKRDTNSVDAVPVPFITLRERIIMLLGGVGMAAIVFVLVFCFYHFLVTPRSQDNHMTHSVHTVRLPKYAGKYGVFLDGNTVTSIRPFGPAYFQGGLQPGDKIVKVNGVDTTRGGHEWIMLLVSRTSDLFDVELEVRSELTQAQKSAIERLNVRPFYLDHNKAPLFFGCCFAAVFLVCSVIHVLCLKSGTAHSVTIARIDGGKLGIWTRGATICGIIPGGAAELQGCDLKAGDEIIAINGNRVVLSFYWTIWKLLKADVVKLAIKRHD